MNYEIIRIAAALIGTGAAAWQDHKTSFIDDRIVYAMIGIGLVLDVLTFDQAFITNSVGIAAVVFAIGYLFYRTGQLGGGDVLLFAGIQLLLPYAPDATAALGLAPVQFSLMPFLVSVIAASSLYALAGTAAKYALELRGHRLKPDLPYVIMGVAAFAAVLNLASKTGGGLFTYGLFSVMILPGIFLMAFKRQITDELIIRKIRIAQIEDEDILATEKMPARIIKKYGVGRVLTKKQVEKLRKIEKAEKMHLFPVYKNLPRFGPYILLALATCLIVGDLFVFLAFRLW
jgi:Flp pilus assembly protein protease CpaA